MKKENKEPEKFTNCSYRTRRICHCSSDFWTIRTVKLKNHEVWTFWQNFSSIQRWTKLKQQSENSRSQKKRWKMLLQCEINFSLLKHLLQDPNGQIEVTHSIHLLTKFQPDPTVNKSAAVVGSFWRNFLLFSASLSLSMDGTLDGSLCSLSCTLTALTHTLKEWKAKGT